MQHKLVQLVAAVSPRGKDGLGLRLPDKVVAFLSGRNTRTTH